MPEHRTVMIAARVTPAEHAAWREKAAAAGVSPSALLRQAMARTRTWTASARAVEVLRGNPDMVAAVADSLDFERKYTSAVIAWAPEDRPTDEQIEAVLDEFEKTAWAGLEQDRYAWTVASTRTSSPRSATSRPGGA